MHSSKFVGFGFLVFASTWAPAQAIGSLLVGELDKKKPLVGMVEKSNVRTVRTDVAQNAAQRVEYAEQEVEKRKLALEREENYANKTNETLHFLEARMNTAMTDLKEVRSVRAGQVEQVEQELKKRFLALEREEHFANKTNETANYLEARANSAKTDLVEARAVKAELSEQELQNRELALEREENFVNGTRETLDYLEEQVKRAKNDLEGARDENNEKNEPLAALVDKSAARTVKANVAQNAALRVNIAEQELKSRKLALEREENYANRTNETVHYLEVRLNIAKNDLKEAQAVNAGQTAQTEQEVNNRYLAMEREENSVNKTNETVLYLESRWNSAKMDLKEARAVKAEQVEQELNNRELALEREENFVNKTNETLNYLEVQVSDAKKYLAEARDEENEVTKHD